MLITGTSHRYHYNTWILKFMIFGNVTPNNFVGTYRWFSGIFYPTNRDNRLFQNTNIHSPQHMLSHPTTVIFIFTPVRNQNVYCFSHTAESNEYTYMMNNDETNKCVSVVQSACVTVCMYVYWVTQTQTHHVENDSLWVQHFSTSENYEFNPWSDLYQAQKSGANEESHFMMTCIPL
jgi:hypothetical protein